MKILLIDPSFGEGGFGSFGRNFSSSQIHPGLCSIGAYVSSKGYSDIKLLDLRALRGWEEFRAQVAEIAPDVAGVTIMSCDFDVAMKAIDTIKEINHNIIVVVGGVHPTVAPADLQDNEKIDHIILGEGEISFVDLLQAIERGEEPEKMIFGVKPDLDSLPFEDRQLYHYDVSVKFRNFPGIFKPPMITMVASRGCPFDCSFCAPHAKTMFGTKVRYRSVSHVIDELNMLRDRYQFNSVMFYDYSLTLSKKWIMEFCDEYQRSGFRAKIWANSRADLICRNEDAIKRLSEIGLKMLAIRFESGSQRILDFLQKGTTVEQNLEATEICKKYGIIVRGLFMLGAPTETKEDVQATLDMIRKMKPHVYSFSFFTPMPGSHLYEYCKERDLILVKSYSDLAKMGPELPKVKGIDYEYLKGAVEESMGFRFGGKIAGKLIRYIFVKTRSGRWLRLRYLLIYLYTKWVSSKIYRWKFER